MAKQNKTNEEDSKEIRQIIDDGYRNLILDYDKKADEFFAGWNDGSIASQLEVIAKKYSWAGSFPTIVNGILNSRNFQEVLPINSKHGRIYLAGYNHYLDCIFESEEWMLDEQSKNYGLNKIRLDELRLEVIIHKGMPFVRSTSGGRMDGRRAFATSIGFFLHSMKNNADYVDAAGNSYCDLKRIFTFDPLASIAVAITLSLPIFPNILPSAKAELSKDQLLIKYAGAHPGEYLYII